MRQILSRKNVRFFMIFPECPANTRIPVRFVVESAVHIRNYARFVIECDGNTRSYIRFVSNF